MGICIVTCTITHRYGTAGKAEMLRRMKKGEDLAIIPGGFQEATIHAYVAPAYLKVLFIDWINSGIARQYRIKYNPFPFLSSGR